MLDYSLPAIINQKYSTPPVAVIQTGVLSPASYPSTAQSVHIESDFLFPWHTDGILFIFPMIPNEIKGPINKRTIRKWHYFKHIQHLPSGEKHFALRICSPQNCKEGGG